MKLSAFLGALAGVTVLALPVAAHAADYERFSASDPSHADDPNEPSTAGIDLVRFTGNRTDQTITMTATFRNFRTVAASRRIVVLGDPESRKARALEYRTAPSGKVQTEIYVIRSNDGPTEYVPTTCRGFGIEPRASKDRLVFTLPARCYPGRDADGAIVQTAAVRWADDTWSPGPLDTTGNPPSEVDQVSVTWFWSGDMEPLPTGSASLDLF